MPLTFLAPIRTLSFSARVASFLGFQPSAPGATRGEVERRGVFWLHPLFTDRSTELELAVRLLPGVEDARDLPLLLVQHDRARTLATTLRQGLPLAMLELALSAEPSTNWDLLLERRTEAEPELRAMEDLLGGDRIGALFDVLGDGTLRDQLVAGGAEGKAAFLELTRRLDPEQGAARQAVAALGGDGPLVDGAWGPWSQVVATANLKRALKKDARANQVEAAWAVFAAPGALDAGMPGLLKQPEPLRWSGKRWSVLHAAKALAGADDVGMYREDPLWPAIEALAEQGVDCDGLPFVEAAAHLDEAGQSERAWAALANGAYLSHQRLGQALRPIAEAAAFLAKSRGWSLASELLDARAS